MEAPADIVPSVEAPVEKNEESANSKPALTPPTSEDMDKREERMSSELSELESDDDGEEIEPDHYFEGGKIPVFKPVRCASLRFIAGEDDQLCFACKSNINCADCITS